MELAPTKIFGFSHPAPDQPNYILGISIRFLWFFCTSLDFLVQLASKCQKPEMPIFAILGQFKDGKSVPEVKTIIFYCIFVEGFFDTGLDVLGQIAQNTKNPVSLKPRDGATGDTGASPPPPPPHGHSEGAQKGLCPPFFVENSEKNCKND